MKENKKVPNTTITRNTSDFSKLTGNIYETVAMLSKRADQLAKRETEEIKKCKEECKTSDDDVYENRELVERIKQFEVMPKPTLAATSEYLDDQLQYSNPAKEDQRMRKMQELEDQVIAEKESNK